MKQFKDQIFIVLIYAICHAVCLDHDGTNHECGRPGENSTIPFGQDVHSKSDLSNSTSSLSIKTEEQARNVTLRIKSSSGVKEMNVTKGFIDFLRENPSTWKTQESREGCRSRCYDNLYNLKALQQDRRYRSLFEMYYQTSVSPGCFCHNVDYFGADEDDDDGPLFQWTFTIGRSHARNETKSHAKLGGRDCEWNNVIYWLLKLIDSCIVYDLGGRDSRGLEKICRDCICR